MKMKKYFVPDGKKNFLTTVLNRDEIDYDFMEIDGRLYIWTPLSCRQYRVMLEDAECEYERSLHKSNTPIYSFRTLMNPEKFQRLKLLNAAYHGFGILSKDVERFEKAVC